MENPLLYMGATTGSSDAKKTASSPAPSAGLGLEEPPRFVSGFEVAVLRADDGAIQRADAFADAWLDVAAAVDVDEFDLVAPGVAAPGAHPRVGPVVRVELGKIARDAGLPGESIQHTPR